MSLNRLCHGTNALVNNTRNITTNTARNAVSTANHFTLLTASNIGNNGHRHNTRSTVPIGLDHASSRLSRYAFIIFNYFRPSLSRPVRRKEPIRRFHNSQHSGFKVSIEGTRHTGSLVSQINPRVARPLNAWQIRRDARERADLMLDNGRDAVLMDPTAGLLTTETSQRGVLFE
jgi:hypothetical protein